jgi:hypothetical protein
MVGKTVSVKYNLKNLKKRTALVQGKTTGLDKMLIAAGETCILNLHKLWQMGKGGTEASLQIPEGKPKYIAMKQETSGRGRIDMFSAPYKRKDGKIKGTEDHMVNSLIIKTKSKEQVAVTFRTPEQNAKARGNYNIRPQFFELSTRIKNLCIDKARKFMLLLMKK